MKVKEYFHSGIIEELFNKGVISWQVYNRFDIYSTYQNYLIKEDRIEAIKDTAIDHDVSYLTVKRAIKMVEA